MIGSMQLSVVGQTMEGFGSARTAAHGVFKIIDTEPLIDSLSKEGKKPNPIKGKISFSNVNFTYPGKRQNGFPGNHSLDQSCAI